MNKIGFKNFRRFTDFPDLEYGPITFLVGRNNAGKSTLVKAILLINNYLKSYTIDKLDFGNNILEDINIVTFGRAKNKTTINDLIQFKYQIGEFEVFLEVTGMEEDTQAKVITLSIKDLAEGFYFELKPQSSSITVGKTIALNSEPKQANLKNIFQEIALLNDAIHQYTDKKTNKEYIELVDKRNQLMDRAKNFNKKTNDTNDNRTDDPKGEYSTTSHAEAYFDPSNGIANIIEPLIIDVTRKAYILNPKDNTDEKEKKKDPKYTWFFEDKFKIEKSFKKFASLVSNNLFVYLGANSFKQKSLFSIKDTLNPLAQAINEYKQLGIDLRPSSPAYTFTRKWMQDFEIGDDFEIRMHAGEAYEVLVKSHKTEIPLADKGMGSVQAMLLILRLACIIDKYGDKEISIRVVIEEPELNLHPALQSKLADMFLFVNELKLKKQVKCNIEFIIETHSEYLIRKTQLLVKDNEFEVKPNENPFCVIYFDKEMKQWKMNYREDGVFVEDFGTGFFDVATQHALSLIKRKKKIDE